MLSSISPNIYYSISIVLNVFLFKVLVHFCHLSKLLVYFFNHLCKVAISNDRQLFISPQVFIDMFNDSKPRIVMTTTTRKIFNFPKTHFIIFVFNIDDLSQLK